MNTETKQELKKEFREKFNYASFTWNGNNVTGVEFAKKERNRVEKFWLSKLDQALKSQRDSLVEKVDRLFTVSFRAVSEEKLEEYVRKSNLLTLLKEDNTQ